MIRTLKTKQDIRDHAFDVAKSGGSWPNPYKEGSWQYKAHCDGWYQGLEVRKHALNAAEAGVVRAPKPVSKMTDDELAEELGVTLATFPARMPAPVREHVSRLSVDALSARDSTRALRLDRKITALYERYA